MAQGAEKTVKIEKTKRRVEKLLNKLLFGREAAHRR
jgi:hypothetical protein